MLSDQVLSDSQDKTQPPPPQAVPEADAVRPIEVLQFSTIGNVLSAAEYAWRNSAFVGLPYEQQATILKEMTELKAWMVKAIPVVPPVDPKS